MKTFLIICLTTIISTAQAGRPISIASQLLRQILAGKSRTMNASVIISINALHKLGVPENEMAGHTIRGLTGQDLDQFNDMEDFDRVIENNMEENLHKINPELREFSTLASTRHTVSVEHILAQENSHPWGLHKALQDNTTSTIFNISEGSPVGQDVFAFFGVDKKKIDLSKGYELINKHGVDLTYHPTDVITGPRNSPLILNYTQPCNAI